MGDRDAVDALGGLLDLVTEDLVRHEDPRGQFGDLDILGHGSSAEVLCLGGA